MQTVDTVSKVNGNDVEAIVTTVNYMESTTSVSKTYYKDGRLYGNQDGMTFKAQLTIFSLIRIFFKVIHRKSNLFLLTFRFLHDIISCVWMFGCGRL